MDEDCKSTAQAAKNYHFLEGQMMFYRAELQKQWCLAYCETIYESYKEMEAIAYA